MSEEQLQKRVDQLESEIKQLWSMIRAMHDENRKTVENMRQAIAAANDFRDRILSRFEQILKRPTIQ